MNKLKLYTFEFDKALIFASLFLLLLDVNIFLEARSFQNGVVIKWFVLFQFYVFRDETTYILKWLFGYMPKFEFIVGKKDENWHKLDWICVQKLVEYMLKTWKFAIKDMEKLFWITPPRHKKLWDALEMAWILERWPNNSRVLKSGMLTMEVLDHLSKFTNSSDVTPLLRRKWSSAKLA